MTPERRLAAISAAIGFLAGAFVVAVVGVMWERRQSPDAVVPPAAPQVLEGAPMMTEPAPTPLPVSPTVVLPPGGGPVSGAVADLRARLLEVPVFGTPRDTLRSTFDEARSGSRVHEALDILAPTGTPVVAVEDGTVAKLFLSEAGGITIYLFDPTRRYAYYYAHLDRYAPDLREGAGVRRGQTLGYVGVSGNAPKDTPHLHFAIFELTDAKQWWQGTPIDPYLVLR